MIRRRRFIVLAIACLAALLAGCQSTSGGRYTDAETQNASTTAVSTFSADTVVAALTNAGLSVKWQPYEGKCIFGSGANPRILSVDGTVVQVFEFADESIAKKAAAGVSAGGSFIKGIASSGSPESFSECEFRGRPHFYRNGCMIMLYVESGPRAAGQTMTKLDEQVTGALESVMGRQFAGD